MSELSNNELKKLYFQMKKIRMAEEEIADKYHDDNMHTPIHLCIGEEATAVGVCFNLRKTDMVFSNHRNHGHYIAKGGELNSLIAELHNKETGCCGGYGGSMHLIANDVGFPITSSIVAGGVPIGTGSALAMKMRNENNVVVVFLGDAATEEGVVYESIAFAVLKNLPIVYVCENNLYSVGTSMEKREAKGFLTRKFQGMLPVKSIDGNNVQVVQQVSKEYIDKARSGGGPSFIECKTYRLRDHHNTKTGVEAGYQTKEEWSEWANRCPIKCFEKKLKDMAVISQIEIKKFEDEFSNLLKEAFEFAESSSLPDSDKLCSNVYSKEANY